MLSRQIYIECQTFSEVQFIEICNSFDFPHVIYTYWEKAIHIRDFDFCSSGMHIFDIVTLLKQKEKL